MLLLHNIGHVKGNSNYNTPDQIWNTEEQLGFDGVYQNVWVHRELLKKPRKGKTVLFIVGNYVGKDNSFDKGMPLEMFCNWDQIMDLVINYNCELGWHTWSHPDLRSLEHGKLMAEITPPIPMKWFAYPYGAMNLSVAEAVKKIGFTEAWTVNEGDNGPFQRHRKYI